MALKPPGSWQPCGAAARPTNKPERWRAMMRQASSLKSVQALGHSGTITLNTCRVCDECAVEQKLVGVLTARRQLAAHAAQHASARAAAWCLYHQTTLEMLQAASL
eukprot:CAMPEP_0115840810 /NCGR_PEP_ID=MMETSP0287-20121206/6963_1 /TAXON_ID=412157 /ORGANISM="Chrysochromulina rotalis, Strain UIO044" /LENGTH=105 /DNA_ID=CAMNT_0003294433 /DNA_START=209 /DNA_END=525 /DNA_ORIENTATION=+